MQCIDELSMLSKYITQLSNKMTHLKKLIKIKLYKFC